MAIKNSPVSGITMPLVLIHELGRIKAAAAEVNSELGLLSRKKASAIIKAANEVSTGRWDSQFPVDVFQTGSGTSTNMNVNEVIASRASQILGIRSSKKKIHPNDDVNKGQSSNDVIPTAIHMSSYVLTRDILIPCLSSLEQELRQREKELSHVIKTGRTHLMDAMPVSMGQEMGGWAHQISEGKKRISSCLPKLAMLAIGGTAVGTGINTHPEFGKRVARKLALSTGRPFRITKNHFAAQSSMDTIVELSGQIKTVATALLKIANDIRLMNSGPNAGFAEIVLPELQAGSSIMPGKVNPVICESMMMACVQVISNDLSISIGNSRGDFQLNTMLPLMAHNILQSITILGNSATLFANKVIAGFIVNYDRISYAVEKNPVLSTILVPIIGYEKVAEIVKRSIKEDRSVFEIASEMTDITERDLKRLLSPKEML